MTDEARLIMGEAADVLEAARVARGWSVREVAIGAGVNWHTARDALRGSRLSLTAFNRVARALGFTVYLEVEPDEGDAW